MAVCVADDATVVYINGIFTTESQARNDVKNLSNEFIKNTGNRKIKFINGYNPSHIAGLGDITQAAAQTLNSSVSSFDRDTILLQIHPQVTTRKLLLVGHSQGAFYSNALYDYLLAHGEPKAAVGVYQVGTPASSVSGGGKYVTSSNDAVINAARLIASSASDGLVPLAAAGTASKSKLPLPANITLGSADYGHGFSNVYLAEVPERIVGDIQSTLKSLKAESATESGECFTAPNSGLSYQAAKAGFALADTAAAGIRTGVGAAQVAAVAAGNVLASVAQGAYGVLGKLATDIGSMAGGVAGLSKAAEPVSRPTNFDIFSKLYGSSLTKDEYKELLGSAIATAPIFTNGLAPQVVPQEPQSQVAPEVEAPKKITYLRGSRSHDTDEQEDTTETPAEVLEPAPVEETPSTEPELTPEAEPEPEPQAPAYSVVFEDSFDTYNDKGWQTPGNGSLIPFDLEQADSGLCHSGSCIVGMGGLGGFGTGSSRPYIQIKVGDSLSGFLTVWAKRQDVWRAVTAHAALCVAGTDCATSYWKDLPVPNDNEWHQYLFAWRPGTEYLQLCVSADTTTIDACEWSDLVNVVAGIKFDSIGLTGMTLRSDLGDRIWFDDVTVSVLQ